MIDASLPLMDIGTDNRKRLQRLRSGTGDGERPIAVLFIGSVFGYPSAKETADLSEILHRNKRRSLLCSRSPQGGSPIKEDEPGLDPEKEVR